ncbi:dihydrofolate reductase family protein [Fervidobacterium thailandense]|uniref:dihydrofolate reductase n=1 Tax=Fervidobacterium thailandense TaxID=1008305 RepID=A0A1E3G527_9BACT|nr:dihydrofolate reductase family protein [Fervidobacterium thailandense]ODN31240.1 dihydrofolate reductase [Fervidobacterium thailandense]
MRDLRVRLVAVTDARGVIAVGDDDPINWSSREDKELFKMITLRSGVVIMGRKTYEAIGRPLPGRLNVVLSSSWDWSNTTPKPDLLLSGNVKEVVEKVKKIGYNDICVIGGQSVFTQFVESGLLTDIHLTIEPIILPGCINLLDKLSSTKEKLALRLEKVMKLNDIGTLHIHYRVGRSLRTFEEDGGA